MKISDLCVKLENGQDPSVPPKSFTFDSVYDDKAPTEAIYNDICYPLVEVSITLKHPFIMHQEQNTPPTQSVSKKEQQIDDGIERWRIID